MLRLKKTREDFTNNSYRSSCIKGIATENITEKILKILNVNYRLDDNFGVNVKFSDFGNFNIGNVREYPFLNNLENLVLK